MYLLLFAVEVLYHLFKRSHKTIVKLSIVFLWSDSGRRAVVDGILTELPTLKTTVQHRYITMPKYLNQW